MQESKLITVTWNYGLFVQDEKDEKDENNILNKSKFIGLNLLRSKHLRLNSSVPFP